MTYVMLKESGGRPLKAKDVEPEILGAKFPNPINTIGGIVFYDNHITFTNEYGTEVFVPLSSVLHIDFEKEVEEQLKTTK